MNGQAHDPARLTAAERERLEETLASYALGALADTEAQDVARHLTTCAACRALAAELGTAAALLPLACDAVEPAPDLKGRILAAVEAEREGPRQPSGLPLPPEPPTAREPGAGPVRPRSRPWTRTPWTLATAALLLVCLGLGAWNLQLRQERSRQAEQLALYQTARQTWALAGTSAVPLLLVRGLPPPGPDRSYQVWLIRDGRPASARVLPAGAGIERPIELEQPLTGAQTVAITNEPAGGSPGPTGPILLAGEL
jgi:anti-sigma-K factor RskA